MKLVTCLILFSILSIFPQELLRYVTPNGAGNKTGVSWGNAWSLADINGTNSGSKWSYIQDWIDYEQTDVFIFLSGGTDSSVYYLTSPININANGSSYAKIHIWSGYYSTGPIGHNGKTILTTDTPDYSGSYELESLININQKNYISIKGISFGNVTGVDPDPTSDPPETRRYYEKDADGIQDPSPSCIKVYNSSNINISYCSFNGSYYETDDPRTQYLNEHKIRFDFLRNIWVDYSSNVTIENNNIFVTGVRGIGIDRSSNIMIQSNTITTEENFSDTGHQIDCIQIGGLGKTGDFTSDEKTTIRYNTLKNSSKDTLTHDDCIQFYTDIKADVGPSVSGNKKYNYGSDKYQVIEIYGNYIEQVSINDPRNSGIIIGGCDDDGTILDNTPYSSTFLGAYFNINYQQGKMTKWFIWSNIIRHSEGTNLININNMDPAQIQIFNNTIYQAANTTDAGPVFIIYNMWNSDGDKLDGTLGTYSTLRNFYLRNNIFYSSGEPNLLKFGHYYIGNPSNIYNNVYAYCNFAESVTIDYNWYYNSGNYIVEKYNASTPTPYSFSSTPPKGWLNGTYDNHGGKSNPQFTTSTPTEDSHFTLSTQHSNLSPCIDKGYTLTISDIENESQSYDGTVRGFNGPKWDIGAYEVDLESWIPPRDLAIKGGLGAFPNPFNPTTNIKYTVPNDGQVSLIVYNILGKEVIKLVDDFKTAGEYSVTFNGEELSSGVYIYSLKAVGYNGLKKMILMK